MSATVLPQPRRQVVLCESCQQPTAGLLADCENTVCFAALIDLIVAEDRRIDASDD